MSGKITEGELLDALAQAAPGRGPAEARTANELQAETGFSRDRLLAALHLCRAQGRLVVHRVVRETLLGQPTRVPAYTIAPRVTKKRAR